jgi:hypothetical protein
LTFYDVDIYSSKVAGNSADMSSLMNALDVVERHFSSGLVVNAGWCEECKTHVYTPGEGSPLFHAFRAREQPVLEIVQGGNFTWRKKRGMGRSSVEVFLQEQVKRGEEIWFQLELSEF